MPAEARIQVPPKPVAIRTVLVIPAQGLAEAASLCTETEVPNPCPGAVLELASFPRCCQPTDAGRGMEAHHSHSREGGSLVLFPTSLGPCPPLRTTRSRTVNTNTTPGHTPSARQDAYRPGQPPPVHTGKKAP